MAENVKVLNEKFDAHIAHDEHKIIGPSKQTVANVAAQPQATIAPVQTIVASAPRYSQAQPAVQLSGDSIIVSMNRSILDAQFKDAPTFTPEKRDNRTPSPMRFLAKTGNYFKASATPLYQRTMADGSVWEFGVVCQFQARCLNNVDVNEHPANVASDKGETRMDARKELARLVDGGVTSGPMFEALLRAINS